MARVVLPSRTILPQESIPLSLVDVDSINGNMFLNNGNCFLYVYNYSVNDPCTITVYSVPDEAGRTGNEDYLYGHQATLTAGIRGYFGPFTQSWWNQTLQDIGYIYVDFSEASTKALVIQL